MNAVHEVKKQAQHAADEARRQLNEVRATRALQQGQEQLLAALREQTGELQMLRKELGKRQKSGGGFPWGLVVLAGAGYALYRSNPSIRERIDGLLNRADPGVKGNLTRAGDAVNDAVDDLKQGQNPGGNFGKVAGEAQRAGEKTADRVSDTVKDAVQGAKDQAREIVDDAKRESATRGQA